MTGLRKFSDWVDSYRNGYGTRPSAGEAGPIVLRIADVSSGVIDLTTPRRGLVSPKDAKTYSLKAGDLLFVRVNGTREIVGRCCVVPSDLPVDTVFNDHLIRVRLKPELDPEFACSFMGSSVARAVIEEAASTSAGQLTISQQVLDSIDIPDLSLAEQRQVAARLKSQLAEVEAARQAAQAQVRDAKKLRRALLESNFNSVLKRYERRARLADICVISAGGTPSRGNATFFRGDIPWVKTLDLNLGFVTSTQEKITAEGFREIRGEMLPVGTVMVAMYGGVGTIGKSGILGIEACTNQAICALKPDNDMLDPIFLHEWLCYIRPEWMRYSGGNRKDPNINKSVVENMKLSLPPLEEQRQFLQHLKAQLIEADAIRQAAATQLAEIERLPQRLLAQAFGARQGASP